jgi:RNA polymerase subunit RPABC4/transcription elongation factor Spt4
LQDHGEAEIPFKNRSKRHRQVFLLASCQEERLAGPDFVRNLAPAKQGGGFFLNNMKYCNHCKRLSVGKPVYCPYCGKTYEVRVCNRCRRLNLKQNLFCLYCGSQELSEIAGDVPWWILLLKIVLWSFLFLAALGFLLNLASFAPFLVVIGLLLVGYSFLPEEVKKITNFILSHVKRRIFGVKKEN